MSIEQPPSNIPNSGIACCLGMRRWKRKAVTSFLAAAGLEAVYFNSARSAVAEARRAKGCIVVWASKSGAELKCACARAGVQLLHMEDGFLRSRGLGASHVEPVSLVLDGRGIYYDATHPSDLEVILETADFSNEELSQARALREQIVNDRLSKYNVGHDYQLPPRHQGTKTILVPGQVGDDASLRFGAGTIATNLDLLRAARRENPDAFIVYKPHPDVEAGKRRGLLSPATVLRYADFIGAGLSSHAAVSMVDEIITMTSLLGFEALLRGKAVTCHGMPFYAGWGATDDRMVCSRRAKARSVDEILAAAYLRYARYIDPATGRDISALDATVLLSASPA